MELRLDGKCALVTGASSGFGRHFARVLAKAGADVALCARRKGRLEEEATRIAQQTGRQTCAIALDVASTTSIENCVAEAIDGLGRIDLLVNNAGTVTVNPSLRHTEEQWDHVMGVNLKGAFFMAQACAKHMSEGTGSERAGGAIVNISSLLADRVSRTEISYCVSKAGLSHMTRALAYEWSKYNIRVNAIAPGYIATDLNRSFLESETGEKMMKQIPMRRFGDVKDLEAPLLYLLSDAASWTTGHVMTVDGGHSLATP